MKTKKIGNNSTSNHDRKIIYVFQGGGALGAFQVGGCTALSESGYLADMVVGISIGGFNAALLAGNPPEKRIERMNQFWDKITVSIPFPEIPIPGMSKIHNYFGAQYALLFGQAGFYKPKTLNPWLISNGKPEDFSFYDTSPVRDTLLELVDFDYLNEKHVRLCLGATDLESGDFVFFDNTKEIITPEHIMASGALPPGFPAIKINERYYVDGGVYANTPLSKVLEEFADQENDINNVLCFMFDLFSAQGHLPHTMDGMLERIKDIQFSSHSKRQGMIYSTAQNLSHAIRYLGSILPDELRNTPRVKEILKLGNAHRLDLVHIIYRSKKGTELHSKDYNFSAETAFVHSQLGYDITSQLIKNEREKWDKIQDEGTVIYTIEEAKILETAI